ncbi:MAG: cadmium-translocating P-type ATPase [Thermomicrobiales bacterium]|nr:cadmium-translocating P-type ATPase [Thermomicrobiales bacterium]
MSATARLPLSGLLTPEVAACEQCRGRLVSSLRTVTGVSSANLESSGVALALAYDPSLTSTTALEEAVRAEGRDLATEFVHEVWPVEGMDCADCARNIERGVARLTGVQSAEVNFAGARLAVEYAAAETNPATIARTVQSMGYRLGHDESAEMSSGRLRSILTDRKNLLVLAGLGLTVVGIALAVAGAPESASIAAWAAAVAVAGWPVARKGIATIRATHRLDINALMMIAVVGAALIGEWLEAATVVVLFSLGEALERYTMDRARNSIRSLMALAPAEALVRHGDHEHRVPVAEVSPGDVVIVRPGERLPVDGVIVAGASAVNQAPVTGESIPVDVAHGASVFAGTINGQGVLDVQASRKAADSTIARIIRMVEAAQSQRAPSQRFVDTFAMYYTPAVIAIAAAVAVLPPLLGGGDWAGWLYRALVLLVIACPCALVISTPVSIVAAISAAARSGVLIKGGAHLEAAGSLRALAFDKTGTLTVGQPRVVSIEPLDGRSADEILALAAAVERYSEHPLGEAIVTAAHDRKINTGNQIVSDVSATTGRGISARVGVTFVRIGSSSMLSADLAAPEAAQLAALEERGQTTVLIEEDGRLVGMIGMADQVRPEAREAIAAIERAGIRETVMLTGDRPVVAQAIAQQAGVDDVRAGLLPDDKVTVIEELLERHGRVGMVGDGVNDAPALARATVGIAMGAAGTDTALETADIALMGDDLGKLAFTVRLSRSAKRIIAQNIGFALILKVVFLVLAVGGAATLWEAVFADVGASLIVILNGMRLLRQSE